MSKIKTEVDCRIANFYNVLILNLGRMYYIFPKQLLTSICSSSKQNAKYIIWLYVRSLIQNYGNIEMKKNYNDHSFFRWSDIVTGLLAKAVNSKHTFQQN